MEKWYTWYIYLACAALFFGAVGEILCYFIKDYKDIIRTLYLTCILFVTTLFEIQRANINKQFSELNGKLKDILKNKHFKEEWNKISERFATLHKMSRKETREGTDKLFSFIKKGLYVLEKDNIPVYNRGEYIGKIDSYLRESLGDKPENIVYLAILNFKSSQSWRASWAGDLFKQLLDAKELASTKGMVIISVFLMDMMSSEEAIENLKRNEIYKKHDNFGPTFVCKGMPHEGFEDNQCAIMIRLRKKRDKNNIIDVVNNRLRITIADADFEKSVIFLEEATNSDQPYAGRIIYNKSEIEKIFSKYDKTLQQCYGEKCSIS